MNRETLPKSRTYPLGTGTIPKGMTQFDYMHLVYDCRLTKQMKHVLAYLALRYNFQNRVPTKMGQRRVANDLHIDRKTYRLARQDLEKWGWISVKKGMHNNPDRITLLIGHEVPEIDWMDEIAKETQYEREGDGYEYEG